MSKAPPNKSAESASFEDLFKARLDELEARGKKVGITLTHICRGAKIARYTPERWRQKTPLSVKLIDKMEAVVREAEAANEAHVDK